MRRDNIRTVENAFAYFTDCTLATVCDMAMTKSRKVGEYRRQKAIAQHMCDVMRDHKIVDDGNRYNDVMKFSPTHGVELWAKDMEIKFNTNKDKIKETK